MANNIILKRPTTGLIVIDIQERLYAHVERSCETFHAVKKIVQAFKILNLPILITEQSPEKMGPTLLPLREELPADEYQYVSKTTFSCMGNDEFKNIVEAMDQRQWILVGMEAHVCVLQTAKDLIAAEQEVIVLNDAITSRSIYDYSTAIAEMRDCGVRLSSVETVLFELLADAVAPEFRQISQLIK